MTRLPLALAAMAVPLTTHAADIHILTTGASRAVLSDLAPGIERETGHHLVVQNETAGAVVPKVRAGEKFDLVVVTPAGAKSLGTLVGEATPLAKVGIGVGVKISAPNPPIATQADIRATGHGLTVLGPLPASIQNYPLYVGVVPTTAANQLAATDILARLAAPNAQAALQAHGMETP